MKRWRYIPSEVRVEYTKDSGSGGQHKNKTESCVVLTHYVTGIKVKDSSTPDQHKNKRHAWKELTRRVNQYYRTGKLEEDRKIRKDQMGDGNHGDKKRTYRVKDGIVKDHVSGKKAKLKSILRGNFELLH
ncbi:MAG: Peptide chain release factor RF1 [uncultured marine phage]|uniref:Peptide chain release factor RF1 n=1 Tax=uncultured marine phage TaxID=707152 RepID=A0A8D9FQV4_9VIRU|nr:MAG: Peptide chain release factor RF1 [uncultured marine phage]